MTTDTALAVRDKPTTAIDWEALEKVVIQGDLSKFSSAEKLAYYRVVCESIGLNPAMQPLAYLKLQGKETLYAQKNATDQLRRIHSVSITRLEETQIGDLYTVTAYASMPDGRMDADKGIVSTKGLQGEALANAQLKAVTKAKRRVTLSICGLGFLDETEVDSIPGAVVSETPLKSDGFYDMRGKTEPSDDKERLIDEATDALRELSRIRATSGKKLITEWMDQGGVKASSFDALNSKQLADLREWAQSEATKASVAAVRASDEAPF